PLADPRLDDLEVHDAGEAEAAAEAQADPELQGLQRDEERRPCEERRERQQRDDGLVRAGRARVDDVRVAIGIRATDAHFAAATIRSACFGGARVTQLWNVAGDSVPRKPSAGV